MFIALKPKMQSIKKSPLLYQPYPPLLLSAEESFIVLCQLKRKNDLQKLVSYNSLFLSTVSCSCDVSDILCLRVSFTASSIFLRHCLHCVHSLHSLHRCLLDPDQVQQYKSRVPCNPKILPVPSPNSSWCGSLPHLVVTACQNNLGNKSLTWWRQRGPFHPLFLPEFKHAEQVHLLPVINRFLDIYCDATVRAICTLCPLFSAVEFIW